MAGIGDRIAAFNAMQPEMSDDLQRFLDLVWSHRVVHPTKDHAGGIAAPGADDIYALYARISRFPTGLHLMGPFLRNILALPVLPDIQCFDWLTDVLVNVYGATEAPDHYPRLAHDGFKRLVDDAERSPSLVEGLAEAFFHFSRGGGGCTDRIYLHVRQPYLMTVMRHILEHMMRTPDQNPGLTNAKMSTPGGSERADSIVLYLASPAAVQAALDDIASYQHLPGKRELFAPGHTRATLDIPRHKGIELDGVSTGAEPPFAVQLRHNADNFAAVPGGSTFGLFRSMLIQCALVRTLNRQQDKPEFVRRTLEYFRECGIDPRAPHQHVIPPPLRQRILGFVQQVQAGQH
ncbi:MAG: hypothetical protein HY855_12280 [Burkholderiales bacterium]|nr:hypothetical protein [Burkholderiales bacterium]